MNIICVGLFSVGSASAFEEFNSSETFGLLQSVPRDNLLVEEADTVDVGQHSESPHQAFCWNVDMYERSDDLYCETSCRNGAQLSAHCKMVPEFTKDNTDHNKHCFCMQPPSPPTPAPTPAPCEWSGWTESKGFKQECTNQLLPQFKHEGGTWTSLGQPLTLQEWAPGGACVAWVQTSDLSSKTCNKFCENLGKECVKAEDDADQVPCTIHQRVPRVTSCTQTRLTQMCACK